MRPTDGRTTRRYCTLHLSANSIKNRPSSYNKNTRCHLFKLHPCMIMFITPLLHALRILRAHGMNQQALHTVIMLSCCTLHQPGGVSPPLPTGIVLLLILVRMLCPEKCTKWLLWGWSCGDFNAGAWTKLSTNCFTISSVMLIMHWSNCCQTNAVNWYIVWENDITMASNTTYFTS